VSLTFGSNDETAVAVHLPRFLELGLLQDGEIMCEVEGATHASNLGVLVITDLALHFFSRGLVPGTQGYVVSIALEEIESAEVCHSRYLELHGFGAFEVVRPLGPSDPKPGGAFWDDGPRYVELLDVDETYHEIEETVPMGWRYGSLYVTDRRVAYFMGGVLWPHRCVVSLPFDDDIRLRVVDRGRGAFGSVDLVVEHGSDARLHTFRIDNRARAEQIAAAIVDRRSAWLARDRGRTRVAVPVHVLIDGIRGGRERAEQIVATILRQKNSVGRFGSPSTEVLDVDPLEVETEPLAPPVSLGRGVARWVTARGGRLYVWGDEFGGGFETMKASVERPDGVEFVPTDSVAEFELYVEDGMTWSRPIRLGRRWFGLRDGISVDTGLMVSGGV
jgi:hypothetical protein